MSFNALPIAKTRLQAAIDQVLNTSSLQQLKTFQDAMRAGTLLGDLIRAGAGAIQASAEDLDHMLNDIYNRNGQGYWGPNVEPIATEGIAQAIQRMLYTPDDKPRLVAKRIDTYWLSPTLVTFYSNHITESDYQITLLGVTPPKPEQTKAYAQYQQLKQTANLRDTIRVPRNLTREENIWIVTSREDAQIYGVDDDDNPVKLATNVPRITPWEQVIVARSRCEDYNDFFIQNAPSART